MTNLIQIQTSSPPALPGSALATSLNTALGALAVLQASGTAPTASGLGLASRAGVLWHDLSTGNLNIRNQADSAWLLWGNVNETLGSFTSPQPFGVTVTGTYQVPNTGVQSVFVNASGSSGLVQFPPGPPANFSLFVIKTDNTTNTVTVSASGGQLISGAASLSVSAQWGFLKIKADPAGTFWVKS